MTPLPTVLIIEDDKVLADICKDALESADCAVVLETSAEGGLARAAHDDIDVVVADLHLTGDLDSKEGFTLIQRLRSAGRQFPIILMTGDQNTENAIEGMKMGAYDYIFKPGDPHDPPFLQELRDLIGRAFTSSRPVSEPKELGGDAPAKYALIGSSNASREVYKQIGWFAPTPVTVLILGETGTGKELVARAVHRHSDRLGKPFIAVNCAATTETLMESELFGHEKGAFTDAHQRRIGRFEQANHGTLFLDEIGDMSFQTQAKLLRVLQERVIRRVGGDENIPVDVRIIAATHHDLERETRQSTFREDLYHRLNKAVIKMPPLRDRKEDIPDLARLFIQRYAAELRLLASPITEDAIAYLQEQAWPGNVRDLENVVCKALLLARGRAITRETILSVLGKTDAPHPIPGQTLTSYVSELLDRAASGQLENAEAALTWDTEYELYRQVIKRSNGNQVRAAKWLGVSRTTMREKLKLYGLHPNAETGSI